MLRLAPALRLSGLALATALLACSGDEVGGTATEGTTTDATTTSESTSSTTSTSTTTTSTSSASGETTGTSTTSTSDPTSTTVESTSGTSSSTTLDTTTGVDTTTGPICGDGAVDPGETCDGEDLGGATCASLGFDGGELACLDTCEVDTLGCTKCGDGDVDPGEECDDGNITPGDGCDAQCKDEPCDPDGAYAIQGPAAAYTCCNNLVSVNVTGFLFTNDGASITSTPSNPVPMTGAATTCPDGKFNNQGSIPGGCTETYKVSGTFIDKDTWMGTYELNFTGQQCSCFNGQFGTPCVNQVFPITAKR